VLQALLLYISLRYIQLHCVSLDAQSFIVFGCSALSHDVFQLCCAFCCAALRRASLLCAALICVPQSSAESAVVR